MGFVNVENDMDTCYVYFFLLFSMDILPEKKQLLETRTPRTTLRIPMCIFSCYFSLRICMKNEALGNENFENDIASSYVFNFCCYSLGFVETATDTKKTKSARAWLRMSFWSYLASMFALDCLNSKEV